MQIEPLKSFVQRSRFTDTCQDFETRLNGWIDQPDRQWKQLEADPHLRDCAHCQQSVAIWRRMSPLLSVSAQTNRDNRPSFSVGFPWRAAVAASILIAWIAFAPPLTPRSRTLLTKNSTGTPPSMHQAVGPPQPNVLAQSNPTSHRRSPGRQKRPVGSPMMALVSSPNWVRHFEMPTLWSAAAGGDPAAIAPLDLWIDRTTPAVHHLQSGVAPIGRTLQTVARLIAGSSA